MNAKQTPPRKSTRRVQSLDEGEPNYSSGKKYEQKKYLWYIHMKTGRALKKQIQYVIKNIYLKPICDELKGLSNSYTLDMITFLLDHKEK